MYAKCNDVSVRVHFPTTTRLVQRGKARVPERTSLHSFNLLWLMWAVCGGFFITNFILSVWLTFLVQPVFEEPVETVQVTSNQGLTDLRLQYIDILTSRSLQISNDILHFDILFWQFRRSLSLISSLCRLTNKLSNNKL